MTELSTPDAATVPAPGAPAQEAPVAETRPLLVAARGGRPRHTPVWFMRQAGRSLPEYRALRAGGAMLDACTDAAMVTEITLQPVRRHGVDAAIFFSDIVVPLLAVGIGVEIKAGVGPVIADPIRTRADLDRLPPLDPSAVGYVTDAVTSLARELGDIPLIGFAGAPFTLASYLVEGGPSKNHEKTKALMHGDPALWHGLLERLAMITGEFLAVQARAGVSALQLFDSWAGNLSRREYTEMVAPHSAEVLARIAEHEVPRIHFGVGTGELLPAMHGAGADVLGVDFRVDLADAAARVPGVPLQGNLDPALLFAPWEAVEAGVRRVLSSGRSAPGHIFNLGHGVLPDTDPDVLTRVVDLVHELTEQD